MLEKGQLGGRKVRVTFRMPAMEGVGALNVCGDFNSWDFSATPLTRAADGSWSAAVTLEGGRSYRFRYRDDRGSWYDDPAADGYVPNEYGGNDSLVDLTRARRTPTQVKPGRKSAPAKKASGRKPRSKGK